jgi:hypothetical protein
VRCGAVRYKFSEFEEELEEEESVLASIKAKGGEGLGHIHAGTVNKQVGPAVKLLSTCLYHQVNGTTCQ